MNFLFLWMTVLILPYSEYYSCCSCAQMTTTDSHWVLSWEHHTIVSACRCPSPRLSLRSWMSLAPLKHCLVVPMCLMTECHWLWFSWWEHLQRCILFMHLILKQRGGFSKLYYTLPHLHFRMPIYKRLGRYLAHMNIGTHRHPPPKEIHRWQWWRSYTGRHYTVVHQCAHLKEKAKMPT